MPLESKGRFVVNGHVLVVAVACSTTGITTTAAAVIRDETARERGETGNRDNGAAAETAPARRQCERAAAGRHVTGAAKKGGTRCQTTSEARNGHVDMMTSSTLVHRRKKLENYWMSLIQIINLKASDTVPGTYNISGGGGGYRILGYSTGI